MSSRPDYANPGTWHSDTVTEIGDVFMVSDGDAHSGRYRAGDFYIAQFAQAIGSKYFPAAGDSDDNWTFAQLGCTPPIVDINGGAAGEVYANGRNQAKITVHYSLTDPDGTALPDAVQKRAKVTLVHTVSGDDPGGDGWRVSGTPGAFVSAPSGSRESGATTVSGDHTATEILYLSHDGSDARSVTILAARVTYGSSVFDDVNGNNTGDVFTVTSLPQVRYQLGTGNCEKVVQDVMQLGGGHPGYSSNYAQSWLVAVDKSKPFTEVAVRTSPGTPPASGSQSNFRNCMYYFCASMPDFVTSPRTILYAGFYWPLSAGGGLDAQDLGLGPYVRVTPVQGAVNVANILQQGPWESASWADKNYASAMTVCRASDAWGNVGYFRLLSVTLDGAEFKPDIVDATEGDFSSLPG